MLLLLFLLSLSSSLCRIVNLHGWSILITNLVVVSFIVFRGVFRLFRFIRIGSGARLWLWLAWVFGFCCGVGGGGVLLTVSTIIATLAIGRVICLIGRLGTVFVRLTRFTCRLSSSVFSGTWRWGLLTTRFAKDFYFRLRFRLIFSTVVVVIAAFTITTVSFIIIAISVSIPVTTVRFRVTIAISVFL